MTRYSQHYHPPLSMSGTQRRCKDIGLSETGLAQRRQQTWHDSPPKSPNGMLMWRGTSKAVTLKHTSNKHNYLCSGRSLRKWTIYTVSFRWMWKKSADRYLSNTRRQSDKSDNLSRDTFPVSHLSTVLFSLEVLLTKAKTETQGIFSFLIFPIKKHTMSFERQHRITGTGWW